MRNLFVFLIIGTGIAFSFRGAFHVLLFYLWNAYFRPEMWTWSTLVQSLRLSLGIGLVLLVSCLFSSERFRGGVGPKLLLLFGVQMLASTALSDYSTFLWAQWIEVFKTLVITYLIATLITTEERLRLTFAVIALSLAFEGAKQAWAQMIFSPGARNTNEWVMLGDNNGVAIGMLMLVPMFLALIQTTPQKAWRTIGWMFTIGVTYRAISTYSRGAFLAAIVLALFIAARSKKRLRALVGVGLACWGIYSIMPATYWNRVDTIQTAADTSEAPRIGFWLIGLEMAHDNPVFGVGLNAYRYKFAEYDPNDGAYGSGRDIHSSWFGLLADLGYPGLTLFVLLIGRTVWTGGRARKLARSDPSAAGLAAYGTALQGQLLVFAIGATFISIQYKEFIWHVLGLGMALEYLVAEKMAGRDVVVAPVQPESQAVAAEPAASAHQLPKRNPSSLPPRPRTRLLS